MDGIIQRLSSLPGKIGFWYHNLVTGETVSCNENVPMVAASVIKLFVLLEAEARISEGTLDKNMPVTIKRDHCEPSCGALTYMHEGLTVTVEDLYTLMIILSDNTATNYLIDLLGMDAINRRIRDLGYTSTSLNRRLFDAERSAMGIENYITACETGDLLKRMAQGTLVNPAVSRDMIRILKNQQLNHKIPFFLSDDIEIAHKTGEDDGISHDAGIVFADQPFVVVFCGNETDVPAYERAMADISLELFMHSKGLEEPK